MNDVITPRIFNRADTSFLKVNYGHIGNLSRLEKLALRSLSNDSNIVIKPADKGGAVVVMNRDLYVSEARRQL
jgi:hypothetical protein